MATKPDKTRQIPTNPSSARGTPSSRGRRKEGRDTHGEEDGPSQPTPEDVPHQRETESDKEDVVLFARHKGKVFKVI